MPSQPGTRPDRGRPRRSRLAAPLWLAGIVACTLVLVVAVAGLTGGLAEAEPEALPAVPVGEVADGEPWRVRVTGAGLGTDARPARLREEANHWLVVIAEVEITAPESRRDIYHALYVSGLDGLGEHGGPSYSAALPGTVPPDDLLLLRDTTVVSALHPGLPERVVFLWERAAGAGPPPAEIEVEIVGKRFMESSVTGRMDWLFPEPTAKVVVELKDLRDADSAEDSAEDSAAEPAADPTADPAEDG